MRFLLLIFTWTQCYWSERGQLRACPALWLHVGCTHRCINPLCLDRLAVSPHCIAAAPAHRTAYFRQGVNLSRQPYNLKTNWYAIIANVWIVWPWQESSERQTVWSSWRRLFPDKCTLLIRGYFCIVSPSPFYGRMLILHRGFFLWFLFLMLEFRISFLPREALESSNHPPRQSYGQFDLSFSHFREPVE